MKQIAQYPRWLWSRGSVAGGVLIALLLLVVFLRLVDQEQPPDPHLMHSLTTPEAVKAVAISDDATLVAAGSTYGAIHMWRVRDGQVLHTWQAHPGQIETLAFTTDNTLLLSGSQDGMVISWDVATGQQRYALPSIRISSQSSRIGSDGQERFFTQGIGALAVHPHQALAAAGGWQGQLLLFEPHTGRVLHSWQGHPLRNTPGRYETITSLRFHPTAPYLASGASEGSVHLWDNNGGSDLTMEQLPVVGVQSLRFYTDTAQLFAVFTNYSEVGVWSTRDGRVRSHFDVETWDIPASVLAHKGAFLIRSGPTYLGGFTNTWPLVGRDPDTRIYITDIETDTPILILAGHEGEGIQGIVRALAISSDDRIIVSGSEDGTVRLWQVPAFAE